MVDNITECGCGYSKCYRQDYYKAVRMLEETTDGNNVTTKRVVEKVQRSHIQGELILVCIAIACRISMLEFVLENAKESLFTNALFGK